MTPQKGTLEYAAWNVLTNVMQVKSGEKLFIIADNSTQNFSTALVSVGKSLGLETKSIILEEHFTRPLLELPKPLEGPIKEADITVFAAAALPGELAFRQPMRLMATDNGARHAHGVSFEEFMALDCLQNDIAVTNAICKELYDRLQGVEWLKITTALGTDARLTIAPTTKWVNGDVDISNPGQWDNIPGGEVFTTPDSADGVYIVDGVLGDYFSEKYGDISTTPVRYEVKDGIITSITCDNKDLEKDICNYVFDDNPNNAKICEIGIGGLQTKELVYNLLQDEKKLGTVHIAHCHNYATETNTPDNGADKNKHCDGVILNPTLITSKGDVIIKEGIYQKK